jgi:hypothetical protein
MSDKCPKCQQLFGFYITALKNYEDAPRADKPTQDTENTKSTEEVAKRKETAETAFLNHLRRDHNQLADASGEADSAHV